MSEFKEFQAKTLDQAIQDACQFYNAERAKLEISILEDAKSGIFGLVGARKARVNARLAEFPSAVASPSKTEGSRARKSSEAPRTAEAPRNAKAPRPRASAPEVSGTRSNNTDENIDMEETTNSSETRTTSSRPQPRNTRGADTRSAPRADKPHGRNNAFDEEEEEGESQRKFLSKIKQHDEEELDDSVLEALDREAMARANVLGNMTEAEVRASGQDGSGRNTRGRTPHAGRDNTRDRAPRNDRDRAPRVDRERSERDPRYSRDRADTTRTDSRDRTTIARTDSRDRVDTTRTDSRDRVDTRRSHERPATAAPRIRTPRDAKQQEEMLERKRFYEQKRQQQRESRPPRDMSVVEYDAVPLPRLPLEELDTEKLIALTHETILKLVSGVVGPDAPIEVKLADDRVYVSIESDDMGLLIGREGQHLAAVQYIASRILTRQMGSQIRIQVDTGDYHSRQDARMELLAQTLAEKTKATGRPQSTRPLSAYQRRVIHLALQEDTEIQTRSCGDGTLKRVVIMRRRHPIAPAPSDAAEALQDEGREDAECALNISEEGHNASETSMQDASELDADMDIADDFESDDFESDDTQENNK